MKRLNVAGKIWLSIGIFVLGYVVTTALSYSQGLSTERALKMASQTLFPAAQRSQEVESGFQALVKSMSDAVMTQDQPTFQRAAEQGVHVLDSLAKIAETPDLAKARVDNARALAETVSQYLKDAKRTYGAIIADPSRMATEGQAMGELAGRAARIQSALKEATRPLSNDLNDQLSLLTARSVQQRWFTLGCFSLTLLLSGAVVTVTIRRAIMRPILRALQGFAEAAEKTASASDLMRQSGDRVARDAQDQAACIEETSASLEEISTTTEANARRAGEADRMMTGVRNTVSGAEHAMESLTRSMNEISESSRQVAGVLKSIDEISFHTNILALNAAVEAARAGQAGAGFSVVADEVRALAKRAADAARQSSEIIEKTLKDVAGGVQLASVAHQAFTDISTAISDGSKVVSDIAAISQQQATSIAHINQAIARIESVTQSNAASAQQTADAASNVNESVQTTRTHLKELSTVIGVHQG